MFYVLWYANYSDSEMLFVESDKPKALVVELVGMSEYSVEAISKDMEILEEAKRYTYAHTLEEWFKRSVWEHEKTACMSHPSIEWRYIQGPETLTHCQCKLKRAYELAIELELIHAKVSQ